ncbi:DUF4339 domain-containing protein [Stratiformator vulcanicus]|uniref:GYF domain-containing protein n=1 Tax=Stratiformator vulcanicus TaxID=2527980 RepID=A0A517QX90_9PLAN|nr:DUF4339 domain-containing protein [Stratiformator vulcanicus]QDT36198.1 hypothetical protein Pan189_05530 [Stratiformator vulcanicus]
MSDLFYVAVDGKPAGPFEVDALPALHRTGQISLKKSTYVLRKGTEQWVPAHDVPELQQLFARLSQAAKRKKKSIATNGGAVSTEAAGSAANVPVDPESLKPSTAEGPSETNTGDLGGSDPSTHHIDTSSSGDARSESEQEISRHEAEEAIRQSELAAEIQPGQISTAGGNGPMIDWPPSTSKDWLITGGLAAAVLLGLGVAGWGIVSWSGGDARDSLRTGPLDQIEDVLTSDPEGTADEKDDAFQSMFKRVDAIVAEIDRLEQKKDQARRNWTDQANLIETRAGLHPRVEVALSSGLTKSRYTAEMDELFRETKHFQYFARTSDFDATVGIAQNQQTTGITGAVGGPVGNTTLAGSGELTAGQQQTAGIAAGTASNKFESFSGTISGPAEGAAMLAEGRQLMLRLGGIRSDLERELRDVQASVERLVQMAEMLDRVQRSDFVIVTGGNSAVGIAWDPTGREGDRSGRFVARAVSDDQARWAILAGYRNRIPVIRDPRREFRDGLATLREDEDVPDEFARELAQLWKSWSFIKLLSDDAIEFAVLKRSLSDRSELGIFLGADDNSLSMLTSRGEVKTVSRRDVDVGSARKAEGENILDSATFTDFVDYALLNVAHRLRRTAPGHVRVLTEVSINSAGGAEKDWSKEAIDEIANSPRARDVQFRKAMLATFLFRRSLPLVSAIQEIRDTVGERLARLGIPRATPSDSLHDLLQEEGVTAIRDATGTHRDSANQTEGFLASASHVLSVAVSPSSGGAPYHLSFRLIKTTTGEVVWQGAADRCMPPPSLPVQFHLDSGNLSIATVKEEFREDFRGAEVPPLLGYARTPEAPARHLVYVEEEGDAERGTEMWYRTPFYSLDKENHRVPRDQIAEIESIENALDRFLITSRRHDDDKDLALRYVMNQLLRKTLPRASRARFIREGEYVVDLGRSDKIQIGDRLRVFRPSGAARADADSFQSLGSDSSGLPGRYLATLLKVKEIQDRHAIVTVEPNGLEAFWQPDEIRPEDIVVTRDYSTTILGFIPPIYYDPLPTYPIYLRANRLDPRPGAENFEVKKQKFFDFVNRVRQTTVAASGQLTSIFGGRFDKLGIRYRRVPDPNRGGNNSGRSSVGRRSIGTDEVKLVNTLREDGATHVIGAKILPYDYKRYVVELGVIPPNINVDVGAEFTELFQFTVDDKDLGLGNR